MSQAHNRIFHTGEEACSSYPTISTIRAPFNCTCLDATPRWIPDAHSNALAFAQSTYLTQATMLPCPLHAHSTCLTLEQAVVSANQSPQGKEGALRTSLPNLPSSSSTITDPFNYAISFLLLQPRFSFSIDIDIDIYLDLRDERASESTSVHRPSFTADSDPDSATVFPLGSNSVV